MIRTKQVLPLAAKGTTMSEIEKLVPVGQPRIVRPWRTMRSAPKNGMEIEVLVYHANRRYAKRSEKAEWESIERARWIDHNGGGWTWKGMHGQFRGWRPPEKVMVIAERCADALLTACDGKPCQRLQLMRGKWEHEETNMGGWCRDAIVDQIVDVLMESWPNASVLAQPGEISTTPENDR